MNRAIKFLAAVFFVGSLSAGALAAGYADVGVLYTVNNTNMQDGLDDSSAFALRGGMFLAPRIAIEAGYRDPGASSESGADAFSAYNIRFDPADVTLGVMIECLNPANNSGKGFGIRAGLVKSDVEITAADDYFGVKPAQSSTISRDSTGYYVELGASFGLDQSNHLFMDLRFGHLRRPDVLQTFNGSMELRETWVGSGVGYRF